MTSTPARLVQDLQYVGVPVEDIWDLVNSKQQYPAAVPVLIEWLKELDDRVIEPDQYKIREALVRALSVPAARPTAAPVLIEEFQKAPNDILRWVVGNALSVVSDDSVFSDLETIARDVGYGTSRQMVVLGLSRSKNVRTVPLLIELLGDDTVAAHAIMALQKLKASEARPMIETLADHPNKLIRTEAKKALAKI